MLEGARRLQPLRICEPKFSRRFKASEIGTVHSRTLEQASRTHDLNSVSFFFFSLFLSTARTYEDSRHTCKERTHELKWQLSSLCLSVSLSSQGFESGERHIFFFFVFFHRDCREFFRRNVNARSTTCFHCRSRCDEKKVTPLPLLHVLVARNTPCASTQISKDTKRIVPIPIFQEINPFRRATPERGEQEPDKKKRNARLFATESRYPSIIECKVERRENGFVFFFFFFFFC